MQSVQEAVKIEQVWGIQKNQANKLPLSVQKICLSAGQFFEDQAAFYTPQLIHYVCIGKMLVSSTFPAANRTEAIQEFSSGLQLYQIPGPSMNHFFCNETATLLRIHSLAAACFGSGYQRYVLNSGDLDPKNTYRFSCRHPGQDFSWEYSHLPQESIRDFSDDFFSLHTILSGQGTVECNGQKREVAAGSWFSAEAKSTQIWSTGEKQMNCFSISCSSFRTEKLYFSA